MEQSQAHTPGPWQLQGQKITTEGALGYIALMGESETMYADAKLIVKAPDMAKALDGVLHHNAALKAKYQLPASLIWQIEMALGYRV